MTVTAGPRLVSFDVFDTVITRRVGRPDSAFYLLGRRLSEQGWLDCSPATFAALRRTAEHRARVHAPGAEVTLAEIWQELEWDLGWPAGSGRERLSLELDVERAVVVALPGRVQEISAWRAKQTAVRFVSDTYFDSATVADLLDGAGVHTNPGEVWTSSDQRVSKRRGGLFTRVLADAMVDAADALHIGNDAAIDGRGSAHAGLRSEIRPAGNLSSFEEALEALRDATDGLSSALAGASRLARLHAGEGDPAPSSRIVETAAGVVGPVLTAYVSWLLTDASARGITRVYFVSRDGQILKALAEQFVGAIAPSIELRYLYGSRLAWVLPSTADPADAIEWLFGQADAGTVGACLARLDLSRDASARLAADAGVALDAIANDRTRGAFRALVTRDTGAAAVVRDALARLRANTIAYLEQEGVADPLPTTAFVDVGWKGSLYASLGKLLGSRRPQTAYQFGLSPGGDPSLTTPIQPYLFDLVRGAGYCELGRRAALLVETFCAGTEGVAAGYRQHDDGRWNAALVEATDRDGIAWGVPRVHSTVVEFGRQVAASGLVDFGSNMRAIAATMIACLWDTPQPADARAWGSFSLADGPGGQGGRALAAPYRWTHVVQAFRHGHVDLPHPCAWPAASRLVTPPSRLVGMQSMMDLRALLARGRRRLRRLTTSPAEHRS